MIKLLKRGVSGIFGTRPSDLAAKKYSNWAL